MIKNDYHHFKRNCDGQLLSSLNHLWIFDYANDHVANCNGVGDHQCRFAVGIYKPDNYAKHWVI